MATTTETIRQDAGTLAGSERGAWYFNWKPMAGLLALLSVIFVGMATYQKWAGWRYGLDSTAPEFETYWMTLLYAELTIIGIAFFVVNGWLWLTRDRHLDRLTPREELRRTVFLVSMLLVYAFSFYWAGSYFAEQDATWHQTIVRDTEFTPSHIAVFYLCMPLFITLGTAVFSYAVTRIPYYSRRISIPLVMVVTGPFMLFPWVGMNEWGHAFWITEEWFTVPFHWGFAVFGWAIVGLAGVLLQLMSSFINLAPKVFLQETGKAA